jgi:hypothetical protein
VAVRCQLPGSVNGSKVLASGFLAVRCQLSDSVFGSKVPAPLILSMAVRCQLRSVAEGLNQEVRKFHHSSGSDPAVRLVNESV